MQIVENIEKRSDTRIDIICKPYLAGKDTVYQLTDESEQIRRLIDKIMQNTIYDAVTVFSRDVISIVAEYTRLFQPRSVASPKEIESNVELKRIIR